MAAGLLIASVGGIAIGFAAFLAIGALRRPAHEVPARHGACPSSRHTSPTCPPRLVGASRVLSVVTAGLLLAHKAPHPAVSTLTPRG